jgi:hypothetical protein
MTIIEGEATNHVLHHSTDTDPLHIYLNSLIKDELENVKYSKQLLHEGHTLETRHFISLLKLMAHLDKTPLPNEIIGISLRK